MKNAFDDMKKNDRQAFLLLPFHSERAKRVVVMGMLLGIGGVDLVEIQRSILIELKDPTIDKFDAFVTKLYSEI
ncbi:MAG: hypothetical protein HWD60_02565 [Defluviicoccus sp.]|nr:MAG: hypothetical protein HWD60_02565 [Defluviicoccus sp.]